MNGSTPYCSIAALPWMRSSFSTSTSTGSPCVSQPGFAPDVVPAHRLVAGEDVLDDAREDVAVVRQPVRGRRPLVEDERWPSLRLLERLLENPMLAPKLEHRFLLAGKVHLARYTLKHAHGTRFLSSKKEFRRQAAKPPEERIGWPPSLSLSGLAVWRLFSLRTSWSRTTGRGATRHTRNPRYSRVFVRAACVGRWSGGCSRDLP